MNGLDEVLIYIFFIKKIAKIMMISKMGHSILLLTWAISGWGGDSAEESWDWEEEEEDGKRAKQRRFIYKPYSVFLPLHE